MYFVTVIFFGLFFHVLKKNGFKSVVISLTVAQGMGVCEQTVFYLCTLWYEFR